jgi:histidinol-phosphate aminotransferase
MLAAAARPANAPQSGDVVMIDSNENPLGPSQAAREAAIAIVPRGGRYAFNLSSEVVKTFAQQEGVKPDHILVTVGSTPPLNAAVLAFTSPQRSYVVADPGYEAGGRAAGVVGARVVNVPLTKTYAHDVKAMLAAAPDAGMFYVCTPNNPTGTLTPHADVEYLVANKPKDSIVVVDEAYIHFTEQAQTTLDLVNAGKDVIVLRTFSKVYGMAGLRCGIAIARPDLLEKIRPYCWNMMPVTAVVAAVASLNDAQLVPERRRINAGVRQQTFDWLARNGYGFTPSEANFFMLDVKHPGKEVREAMAKDGVFVGRIWPSMPTSVRVTVGTQEEMERFQAAFQKVMKS